MKQVRCDQQQSFIGLGEEVEKHSCIPKRELCMQGLVAPLRVYRFDIRSTRFLR